MTISRDPRYDIRLVDSPDGATVIDEVPLILRESGGALDFSASLSSPFYGRVVDDDLQDKDNSRFQVVTQRDWRGGLGQEHTYEDPAAFLSGVMDTRFRNQLLLPPETRAVSVGTVADPQFLPTQSGVNVSSKRVNAAWTKRNATDNEGETNAQWATQALSFQISGSGTPVVTTGPFIVAKQITTGEAGFTLSQLEVWLASNGGSSADYRVVVYSNSGGVPNSLLYASSYQNVSTLNLYDGSNYTLVSVSPGLSLSANTSYWIGVQVQGTGAVYWQGSTASGTETLASNSGSWSTAAGQRVSYRVNGGAAIDWTYTRAQLAQSFTAPSSTAYTSLQIPIRASQWGTSPTVQVLICSDSSGAPDTTSPLRTISVSNPGAATVWTTISFSSLSLISGTTYWIVLSAEASASAHNTKVLWLNDQAGGYASGAAYSRAYSGGAFGAWANAGTDFYFIVGSQVSGNSYHYTHTFSQAGYSTSLTTPGGGVTLTQVRLYLQLINWQASATMTLRIRNNSSSTPGGTVIASATITQATLSSVTGAPGWITVAISASLSASTVYHICLEPTAPAEADSVQLDWFCDTVGTNLTGGNGSEGLNSTPGGALSWTAQTFDCFFVLNNGTVGSTSFTVQPVRFSGGWYAAAGTVIYKFNASTSVFDVVNTAGASVTALAAFNGKIYAALGDSTDMIESSTGASGSWSATSGNRRYTWLRTWSGAGYLYAAKAAGGANSIAYTDGTNWTTSLRAGASDTAITGLVGYRNELMVLHSRGVMSLSSEYVYTVSDYTNDEDSDNGKNALTWLDGRMYVPIRSGLNAYDGVRMQATGPDQEEGLPIGQQGRIAAMCGTKTWLFAAVDAGANGTSGVYVFNGQGWHCLALATAAGRRIRALGIESATSANGYVRLWYWEDATPYYLEFPSLADNLFGVSGMRYAPTGILTSSKIGGQLSLIAKDFNSIALWTSNCSSGQTVQVLYEVDNTGIWVLAGTVTQSPYAEIQLTQSQFASKTTAASCTTTTINVSTASTLSDLSPGEFVRIGSEVAQVWAINSATQFTLALPLTNAPAAGVTIYPSGPAGRQIRYRLILTTNDPTKTPRVIRVSIRLQGQVLAKARIAMSPLIEDGMKTRTGGSYPYSAAQLRDLLFTWMKRVKSFYLVDPAGRNWIVKPASAIETGLTRIDTKAGQTQRFKSNFRAEFDEV